jgi:hypothetical protein
VKETSSTLWRSCRKNPRNSHTFNSISFKNFYFRPINIFLSSPDCCLADIFSLFQQMLIPWIISKFRSFWIQKLLSYIPKLCEQSKSKKEFCRWLTLRNIQCSEIKQSLTSSISRAWSITWDKLDETVIHLQPRLNYNAWNLSFEARLQTPKITLETILSKKETNICNDDIKNKHLFQRVLWDFRSNILFWSTICKKSINIFVAISCNSLQVH